MFTDQPSDTHTYTIHTHATNQATAESKRALNNLTAYQPAPELTIPRELRARIPAYRNAGVLVPLFIGEDHTLHVLLTTRGKQLRSHAGDTALPGGRFEHTDRSIEETARREAEEEIGLTHSKHLCQLEPFLSANELVVTPTVTLISPGSVALRLNYKEVTSVFSVPLENFLFHTRPDCPRGAIHEDYKATHPAASHHEQRLQTSSPEPWHSTYLIRWLIEPPVLRHTFQDPHNPIRGLTSDILIRTATIAFGRLPNYQVYVNDTSPTPHLVEQSFASDHRIPKRSVKPRMKPWDHPHI